MAELQVSIDFKGWNLGFHKLQGTSNWLADATERSQGLRNLYQLQEWNLGFHSLLLQLWTKMAELKRAKGKRTTARQKLTVVLIHLEKEIWKNNGRVPTQQALTRQHATLGNAWEAYNTAHTLYAELLVDEEAAEEECNGYHKLYDRYNDVAGKVEELKACRGQVGGPAPTMVDVMQSIAASNQMHQDRQAGFVWCPVRRYKVLAEEDDCCSEVKIKTEQDIVEDQMMKQSLVKELYITAVKTEKIPEAANEVEEMGSLALDESSEEEQCEVTSVSAETGKGMQLDKEEELERLLKATAEGIDDALTQVEDIEQARIEFFEVLRELDEHEDAERSGGSKEQELGNLSIKRFKRMAMERFADAIIDFKAQVERSKAEAEVEVGSLLEVKSEKQELRPNMIVRQGEMGPEQHQRPVIMLEKALWLLKKYSSRMKVMLHQSEEKHTVNSMVEMMNQWMSKLTLKEEASKDKEIQVRTGCG